MAELELQYLHEVGRLRPEAATIVDALSQDIGLTRSDAPFTATITEACKLNWTRDPFDRVIAAEAMSTGARLITKDAAIRAHCAAALW